MAAVAAVGLMVATAAGCGGDDTATGSETDPISNDVSSETVLKISDTGTQAAMELSGLDKKLGFKIEWVAGLPGDQLIQAVRGGSLDAFAGTDSMVYTGTWGGLDLRTVALRETVDPLDHPQSAFGISPGSNVTGPEDLKGASIAYPPGAQPSVTILLLLDKLGLSPDDVEMVEMPTTTPDVYLRALANDQVDVAPLNLNRGHLQQYLAQYGDKGGSYFQPGVREDAYMLIANGEVLRDSEKAAAMKQFTEVWQEAQLWINENPKEFAAGYYSKVLGLPVPAAEELVENLGTFDVPKDWSESMKRFQVNADLLAEFQDMEELDVNDLFDRRFEPDAPEAS
ncbi:ABC transporter substrate-binding protein [Nocardioides sp. GXZ039]|uniref:ABC transporter substrate-binding protein n=1 Tax=Nocardioides sp. GXZ039 TaxID=3136018 RepID=UPI0030F3B785